MDRIACAGTREQLAELALRDLVEDCAAELGRAMQGFDLARLIVSVAVVAIVIGGLATLLSGNMRPGFLSILALPAGASLYCAWIWGRVHASLRELRRSLCCADRAGLSVIVEMRDSLSPTLRWHFAPRPIERDDSRGLAPQVSGHLIARDVKLRSVMDWIVLVQSAEAANRRAQHQCE